MRNDRRLNGWVLLASILGIFTGLISFVAGAGVAVWGFLKPEQLLKFKYVEFFAYHNWIVKLQKTIFNKMLLDKFLFLFAGLIVAAVGLIILICAIKGLIYVKKRKVVRRRVALLLYSIVPLAVAVGFGLAIWKFDSLVIEVKDLSKSWNNFIDILKYSIYGATGVFGTIALFNILGVFFGRSEKFMSNDNNKYAFENSSKIKKERANVNNKVREAQVQPGVKPQVQQNGQVVAQPGQMAQPMQGARPQMQNPNVRPMQQRPMQAGQPQRPMQPARPQAPYQQGQPMRPIAPRPQPNGMQGSSRPVSSMSRVPMQQRPIQAGQPQRPQYQPSTKYCARCGKLLAPGEKVCTLCGHKSAE